MTNSVPIFSCPSCGFVVFNEPAGSYDICPICNWEDDHVQLDNPVLRGGANGTSPFDYQQEVLVKVPVEIREHNGYKRHPKWRPLTEEDYRPKSDIPKSGLEYFQAAGQDTPPYYWEKTQ
ncbi:MAG: hypothetical protein KJZ72_18495 [Anaerolineales bacterium]|nr:hypothetical protein [Anaerolineales bacterium]